MQKKQDFLLRAGYWVTVLLLGYLCGRYLLRYLAPFLVALAIASACERSVAFLRRKLCLKRNFLAAVITLTLVGGMVALLAVILSALFRQTVALLRELPSYLRQLPSLADSILRHLEDFCHACGGEVQAWLENTVTELTAQLGTWLGTLSTHSLQALSSALSRLPGVVLFVFTSALAVFFTVENYPGITAFLRRQIPTLWQGHLQAIIRGLSTSMGQWFRAQLVLLAVTFAELLAGLSMLRVPYALLIAALTAVIDALPVFGSGIILLPWAAVCFLTGDLSKGLSLVAVYAVVTLVHNIAAPKLLAAQSGLPPLVSLLAMYAGFCACGVWGMILFPLTAMLVHQLQQSGLIRLWK